MASTEHGPWAGNSDSMERNFVIEVLGTTRADLDAVRRWEASGPGRSWSGSRAVLTLCQHVRCKAASDEDAVRRCCEHVEAECRQAGVPLLHLSGAVELPTDLVRPLEPSGDDHGWLRGTAGAYAARRA